MVKKSMKNRVRREVSKPKTRMVVEPTDRDRDFDLERREVMVKKAKIEEVRSKAIVSNEPNPDDVVSISETRTHRVFKLKDHSKVAIPK